MESTLARCARTALARTRAVAERKGRPTAREEYRDRPNEWMVEVAGDIPWAKQREINRAVVTCPRVAVQAATGPGKTWNLARLALWWIDTRPNGMVVTTASTWTQVKLQLWAEIRDAHKGSRLRLPGRLAKTTLTYDEKWFAVGLSANRPESLAGFHAKASVPVEWFLQPENNPDGLTIPEEIQDYLRGAIEEGSEVLVIVDESSGVDDDLYHALLGLMTNPGSRMIASGNPTRTTGWFADLFSPAQEAREQGNEIAAWRRFRITAWDAPEWILGRDHIERLRVDCSPNPERHPLYRIRVMGEPPLADENKLFPLSLLERASHGASERAPTGRHLGVDIARHGGDKCVALLWIDGKIRGLDSWIVEEFHGTNLTKTAARIKALMSGWNVPAQNVHIDCTGGWGFGPYEKLFEWGHVVEPVVFSDAIHGDWMRWMPAPPELRNRRQELLWVARWCLEQGYLSITDPKDDPKYAPLWADMMELEYKFEGGKETFVAETSQRFRERTGRSPDYLAALLCSLSRSMPAMLVVS